MTIQRNMRDDVRQVIAFTGDFAFDLNDQRFM